VLAGSLPGGDPLAAHAGVSHKALIEVDGRSMIERVVGALAASAHVRKILIAIERPQVLAALPGLRAPHCPKPVEALTAAASPSESVAAALEREGTPLLATTADHALLETRWLDELIEGAADEADVSVALARKAAVVACAPGTRRTYLRFADGEFSGCNLFLFQRPGALQAVRFWRELEAYRKAPLKMMLRLGAGTALRYRLGQLTLAAATARLGALCDARVEVVELTDGRAAIDVDKPEDLALVRALAASR
jgi:GTP:adenosylcobinamide-phosphate guanylyltransferase